MSIRDEWPKEFKYLNDGESVPMKLKNKLIIETGTGRTKVKKNSGTYYLSVAVASLSGDGKLISIDKDINMINLAKQALDYDNVEFVHADTHDYLQYLISKNTIADFIYLDSANDRYFILTEFKFALQLVEDGSVICIDDWDADKCILVSEYLDQVNLNYEVCRNKLYFKINKESLEKIQNTFNIFYEKIECSGRYWRE